MTTTTPVSFANLAQLVFPTYVTVLLDDEVTGEGQTRGICMLYARTAEELRRILIDSWGTYFCQGCDIHNRLVLVPEYQDLVPDRVREVIKEIERNGDVPSNFIFNTKLHLNYA